jgi:hypothetical protein
MVIARVPEPAVCWRFALITSSISAFPGALIRGAFEARIFRKNRGSDANGCAQNIGRTGLDFQCPVQAINGLLDRTAFFGESRGAMAAAGNSTLEPKQKGRREAGLFSSSTGAQN